MCRRCVIRKGLAVGKSTELGSEAIKACKAWYEKQLNRLGLKESLMELFKAELSGTYMRTGPKEYHRRHPNPVNLGKLICETEPIMTAQRSDFEIADEHDICVAIVKREPVESPTVKNYRNAEGEVVRTDYLNDKGEVVAIEEVLDTAGELRAMGVNVPKSVPDCGWVSRASVTIGPMKAGHGDGLGAIKVTAEVKITKPFRWVTVNLRLGDMPKDCKP